MTRSGFPCLRGMVSLLLLSACAGDRSSDGPLSGEWTIRLKAVPVQDGPVRRASETDGSIVFSQRLPEYDINSFPPPAGTLFGRAYIDFNRVLREDYRRDGRFGHGPEADLFEEVTAQIDSTGTVRFDVAPQIVGFDPAFRGRMSRDTIRGEWALLSHSDTLSHGTFVMWKVRRTGFTDSAFARSRRGIREVSESPQVREGEQVDTLPSVTASP